MYVYLTSVKSCGKFYDGIRRPMPQGMNRVRRGLICGMGEPCWGRGLLPDDGRGFEVVAIYFYYIACV